MQDKRSGCAREEHSNGVAPASSPPGEVDDTPVANPLDKETRALARDWLCEIAALLARELADGPGEGELRKRGVDLAQWSRSHQESIARLRRRAEHIARDVLAFPTAAEIRDILELAEAHRLIGASAALQRALDGALPARVAMISRAIEQRNARHGFHVRVAPGRGEPRALPTLAYTDGLAERAAHPELVIVGVGVDMAAAILDTLAATVLAGTHRLHARATITGLLRGRTLRTIACPDALLAQLPHQAGETPPGALQVLVPDIAGRFPGDPGVDPRFAQRQRYPDYRG